MSALPLPLIRARRPSGGTLLLAALLLVELALAAALPSRPLAVAGLAVAVGGTAVAALAPRLFFGGVLVALVLVPVYAVPYLGPLPLQPAVAGLWALAGVLGLRALARAGRPRITLLDGAVAAFFVTLAIPVFLGVQTATDLLVQVFIWLGPYLGVRAYLARADDARGVIRALTLTGLLVLPLIALEFTTGENPFLGLATPGAADGPWGETQSRLGAQRVEAAFGHSIALAMFLATLALLCLGVAAHEGRSRHRPVWLALSLVFLVGLALTVSRTGWVVVALGIVLLAVAASRAHTRRRLVATVLTGALLAVGVSQLMPGEVPSPVALATESSEELDNSNDYRRELVRQALRPGALTLFGDPDRQLADRIAAADSDSVDNQFLLLAQDWGLVALAGFLAIGIALAATLVRLRRAGLSAVVAAVALANVVALLLVAFITQQQILIWALIGASAGLSARAIRPEAPARAGGSAGPASAPR